ncbi:BfmA/BtgA family mobilization protein [Ulvibacterium marinum]|uniref:BfmA/BtgA family mobilization protein n=1 Tax=Ulvibacterium marinum TaxID=2419782 RepID=UPI0024944B0B|nr:BfmA/BtgA family mobilization protein [Ulvibacterium marinum]
MDIKINRKNTFSAISINRITAERFRAYSKTVSKSHSDTIDTMIDFFEKAKITPKSEVMISFIRFQNYMTGRFDYIEEVLRRMEREQLKPTHDMLKSLFDGTALQRSQQPLLVDKASVRMTREEWDMEEGKVSFEKYHDVVKARGEDRRTFFKVLDKIKMVEPTFGKPYFKVEIDASELKDIREKLK